MPLLDRDGVSIYYEVHGPDGSDAVPLLLSHGFSATAEMWMGNLEALAKDRKVVTWDMRGHGRSDSPDDPKLYSEALSVEDMAAILDAASVQRAVMGGLSLGGYLSLAFHLAHPDRTAALILCDTGPGYRREEPREQWNAYAERTAQNFETRGIEAAGASPEVTAAHHRSAQGLALAARGILKQYDSRVIDSLTAITVPTLVVVGAEDEPFLAAADVMASKIPGATKAVIPGAGHAANIDQPAAFDEALVDFLSNV